MRGGSGCSVNPYGCASRLIASKCYDRRNQTRTPSRSVTAAEALGCSGPARSRPGAGLPPLAACLARRSRRDAVSSAHAVMPGAGVPDSNRGAASGPQLQDTERPGRLAACSEPECRYLDCRACGWRRPWLPFRLPGPLGGDGAPRLESGRGHVKPSRWGLN